MALLAELRQAVRGISRSPAYALICIAVLALGIGANTAIFSVVHSVILRALPYPDADRLVFLWEKFNNTSDALTDRLQVRRNTYLEWRRQANSFTELAAFHETSLPETGAGPARRVAVASASANFLPLLGARPQAGRLFLPDEENRADSRVVVLSDEYYQSRFQRDPKALGASLVLDGVGYTVIGVLPRGFHLPGMWEGMDQKKPEVWAPLSRLWKTPADDDRWQLYVIAKLKPQVSLQQARTEMANIAERLARSNPGQNGVTRNSVYSFAAEDTAPKLHHGLYVLLGAVAFLLLIGCANLANLTFARIGGRSREISIRLALGATRGRIAGQIIAECLLISACGAAFGLLVAHWAIQGIVALKPEELQRPDAIELNLPVFLFAALVSVCTAILFGLAPAISAARTDLHTAMKSTGRAPAGGHSWSRRALVAVEVALAVVLVSGAGLMIRSFRELVNTGIGFPTEKLVALDVDLPEKRYPTGHSRAVFFRDLLARARAVPGVEAASLVDNLPLHRVAFTNFHIAGRPEPADKSLLMADNASISPDYLSMLGMPLLRGRHFTEEDTRRNEKGGDGVVIVNQAWVQKFLNGADALGKRILDSDRKRSFEIVGVVADYRPLGAENGSRPQIFAPNLQLPAASLLVRTFGQPESVTKPLQAAVAALDKDIPTNRVDTMEGHLRPFISQRQFNTLLMSLFAALALLLAMIGVYGVLSNMVAARTREIGIRMAIGAAPSGIARLVLGQSLAPVVLGLAVGLAVSLMLGRYLETLLFQVPANDPWTRVVTAAAILALAPAAIWAPLRRAISVECTVALREE
ncbi:MAG TPA: ABC transporter permease [Bryobacteraceae bacterium]|nr:ABC transporter permease [Bryobacteraceae bacterium]